MPSELLEKVVADMHASIDAPGEAIPKSAVVGWLLMLKSYQRSLVPRSQRPKLVGQGIHKRRT
jgi:hypothetical protein